MQTLRTMVRGANGEILKKGTLVTARSPLASFPYLQKLLKTELALHRNSIRYGRSQVQLPAALPVAIRIPQPGGVPFWQGPFFSGQNVNLRLPAAGCLELRLQTPGKPQGRKVVVHLHQPVLNGTGVEGHFQVLAKTGQPLLIPHHFRGQLTLQVAVAGLAPVRRTISLPEGEKKQLNITLHPGAQAQVMLKTAPPDMAKVALDGLVLPWVEPGGKKTFIIEGVPCDGKSHQISLLLPGRPAHFFWWQPVKPGEKSRHTLKLPQYLRLTANLESAPGIRATGTRVIVVGEFDGRLKREPWACPGQADGKGLLAMDLPRTGRRAAIIFLGPAGPRGMVLTPRLDPDLEKISLGPRLVVDGAAIKGWLTGLEPGEMKNIEVKLRLPLDCPFRLDTLMRRVPVDHRGRFLFQGAGQGEYLLEIKAPGRVGISRQIRLERSDRELRLTLPPGVKVTGQVIMPDGGPAPGAQVNIVPLEKDLLPLTVVTGVDGHFQAIAVPRGPCRVSVQLDREGTIWSARCDHDGRKPKLLKIKLFKEP